MRRFFILFIISFLFISSSYSVYGQTQTTEIDSIKMNDADGKTVMLNDTVNTAGIVTSITQLGTGTSGPGTIQNANTGVAIYGSTFTQTTGLKIGDSVIVKNWKVTQYNGLTELSYTASSTVEIVSSGNTVNPTVVTIPQIKNQTWNGFEKYESMLLRINDVQFVQTGNFDISGSGTNFQIFNGSDTLDFRVIKTNTSLIGKAIPSGSVDIVGILQQYKGSTPYDSGYQLMPLDSSGVISTQTLPPGFTLIDSIKTNDADGISVMLNDTVNTGGIVTSILQLGTGTSGPTTIQNKTTGVAVYGSKITQTPGLQIGDSVIVKNWKVTQYNGLTELGSTDSSSVEIVSSGHTVNPTVVTIPQIKNQAWNGFEKYESMLLQINDVQFVQTGTFDITGSGTNFQIFNGTDTLDFRIVKTNTSTIGKSIPAGTVNIIGILQQYKGATPYNSGYQLMPLDSSGIVSTQVVPTGLTLIDSIKTNDADGKSVLLDSTVTTAGIVTSITQLGTGTSGPGTIQNENTGVAIYGTTFTQATGLKIGDSVIVKNWKVTQYNGLTELSKTDSSDVTIVSSGNEVTPRVVSISQIKNQAWNGLEQYESMLVQINDVKFVETGSFNISGSGTNFKIYSGTDTLDFRIVKTNTSIIGKAIPMDLVNVVGIVQQYKGSTPYDSGYQLMPLDSTGIKPVDITDIQSLKINDETGVSTMLNQTINTTGIVTSINELGTGTSGPSTIQDANTGITLYGAAFTGAPGIEIGDSVLVLNWQVTNYRGLTELSAGTNSLVQIISKGHTVEPEEVTIAQIKNQAWDGLEKYEGMLVKLNEVNFVQTGTFSLNGSTGYNYQIANGTDTLDLRIVKNNTSLIGKDIPTGAVSIVGIIQQYKSSAPYNSGYQIFPLDSSSIGEATAIGEEEQIPYTFKLYQNYPNPFNPVTIIKFELPSQQKVELTVYDILGRKVRTLYNNIAPQGITTVNFNASNLASGVYIYSIRTTSSVISKKLLLLK